MGSPSDGGLTGLQDVAVEYSGSSDTNLWRPRWSRWWDVHQHEGLVRWVHQDQWVIPLWRSPTESGQPTHAGTRPTVPPRSTYTQQPESGTRWNNLKRSCPPDVDQPACVRPHGPQLRNQRPVSSPPRVCGTKSSKDVCSLTPPFPTEPHVPTIGSTPKLLWPLQ